MKYKYAIYDEEELRMIRDVRGRISLFKSKENANKKAVKLGLRKWRIEEV
jgi:hypothetical protein